MRHRIRNVDYEGPSERPIAHIRKENVALFLWPIPCAEQQYTLQIIIVINITVC